MGAIRLKLERLNAVRSKSGVLQPRQVRILKRLFDHLLNFWPKACRCTADDDSIREIVRRALFPACTTWRAVEWQLLRSSLDG